jgi:hypothetical protein
MMNKKRKNRKRRKKTRWTRRKLMKCSRSNDTEQCFGIVLYVFSYSRPYLFLHYLLRFFLYENPQESDFVNRRITCFSTLLSPKYIMFIVGPTGFTRVVARILLPGLGSKMSCSNPHPVWSGPGRVIPRLVSIPSLPAFSPSSLSSKPSQTCPRLASIITARPQSSSDTL